MADQRQKQMLKDNYNYIKNTLNDLKQVYTENGYDVENLQGSQKISVKLCEARMWMLCGLHNANRQQYNKGLKRYMKYSDEMLSSNQGFSSIIQDNINHYDNSEALRQCGLELKKDYDAFKVMEQTVFG